MSTPITAYLPSDYPLMSQHLSQSFEDPSEAEQHVMAKEDSQVVLDALAAARLPKLPHLSALSSEPLRPIDRHLLAQPLDVDLSPLVSTLRAHETPRARQAVRTSSHSSADSSHDPGKSKESAHRALIREINQTLRLEQERGVGTGLARDARWRSHVTEGVRATEQSPGVELATGNTANAALAAGKRASTVSAFHVLPGLARLLL